MAQEEVNTQHQEAQQSRSILGEEPRVLSSTITAEMDQLTLLEVAAATGSPREALAPTGPPTEADAALAHTPTDQKRSSGSPRRESKAQAVAAVLPTCGLRLATLISQGLKLMQVCPRCGVTVVGHPEELEVPAVSLKQLRDVSTSPKEEPDADSLPLDKTIDPMEFIRTAFPGRSLFTKQAAQAYAQLVKETEINKIESSEESSGHSSASSGSPQGQHGQRSSRSPLTKGLRSAGTIHTHKEIDEDGASSDDSDVEVLGMTRGLPFPPKFKAPRANTVTGLLKDVALWSPDAVPHTPARRFLQILEFRLKMASPDDKAFPSRTWQAAHVVLKMAKETDADWVRDVLLPRELPWVEFISAFVTHFQTPQRDVQAQHEFQALKQGHDKFQLFWDKFVRLLSQRGFDVNSEGREKALEPFYIEELTRKLRNDVATEWIKDPVWGRYGMNYQPTLKYCAETLNKLETISLAASAHKTGVGVPANERRSPEQKASGSSSWCTFHKSRSHDTKDCKARRGNTDQGQAQTSATASSAPLDKKVHWQSKLNDHFPKSESVKETARATSDKRPDGVCSHCGKAGHTEDRCYKLHPELRPVRDGKTPSLKSINPFQTLLESDLQDVLRDAEELDNVPGEEEGAIRHSFPHQRSMQLFNEPVHRHALAQENPLPPLMKIPGVVSIQVAVTAPADQMGTEPIVRLFSSDSDSGCTLSSIGKDMAQSMGIPTIPLGPKDPKNMILANGTIIPRLGRTPPIELTFFFRDEAGLQEPFSPLTLTASLEVVEANGTPKAGNQVVFGQDLMALLYRQYVPTMSELNLRRFTIHVIGPLYGIKPLTDPQARKESLDQETSHTNAPEEIPQNAYLDLDKDLDVEPVLEIDPKDESARVIEASKVMARPYVADAIARNASIPKNSFCAHPDALVTMKLKDNYPRNKLYRRQFAVSKTDEAFVDRQVDKWKAQEVIRVRTKPTSANTPLLPVPKMEGGIPVPDKRRITLSIAHINEALDLDQDRFPISGCSVSHQFLAGHTHYGELDVEDCFNQFPLAEDCRELTAFTWRGVQYEFLRAPFGLSFLPSFVNRFVSTQIRNLPFAKAYIDNVQWGSNSWEEHARQLVQLLDVFTGLGIRIKTQDIKLGYKRMRVLGHIVSKEGLTADPRKLSFVQDLPHPQTGKQMERFLGMVGYLRGYVRHYGELSAPLEAVKKDKRLVWTDHMKDCFITLKKAICTAPSLTFPDFTKKFYIATDASCQGVGGVLYQTSPSGKDPEDIYHDNIVAITSKVLSGPMLRYSVYKRELLAVVLCLRKFHYYIWGRVDTDIFTDQRPLVWLFNGTDPPISIQGFMDIICSYTFRLRHIPGLRNVLPDHLSRVYNREYPSQWGVRSVKLPFLLDKDGPVEVADPPLPAPRAANAGLSDDVRISDAAGSDIPINEVLEAEKRGKTAPPKATRESIITRCHSYGHFGRDRVLARIIDEGFWWSGMKDDVYRALLKCDNCARTVIVRHGFKPAQFIMADGPWTHVQVDCMHMPTSAEGYTAVLSIICVFTAFQLLFPILTTSAACVAEKLWTAFAIFGLPKILQSDNGPEFLNKTVQAMKRHLGFEHRFIAPWNPRTDGKVERAFGTISSMFKKYAKGAGRLWPQFIPLFQLFINSSMSRLNKSTPGALMLCRDLQMPSIAQGLARPQLEPTEQDIQQWMDVQQRLLDVVFPAITERVLSSKQKMTQEVNKRTTRASSAFFVPGTRVMTKVKTSTAKTKILGKLDSPYEGPYVIERIDINGNFILKDIGSGELLSRHVPPDQLKLHSLADEDIGEDALYSVEKIVGKRTIDVPNDIGQGTHPEVQYQVKWLGYPLDRGAEDSWVPIDHFVETDLIKKYEANLDRGGSNSSNMHHTSVSDEY